MKLRVFMAAALLALIIYSVCGPLYSADANVCPSLKKASSQLPKDEYISVDGINTRYWSAGKEGKPAVILIHGFGASVEIWQHNILALSKNHRVYALDLVGFGCSDKPSADYSPTFLVNHVNGFVNAMKIKKATIVGLSMGGGTAILYTLTYPEKVEKLILVDSAGLGDKLSLGLRLMSVPILGASMTIPSWMTTYWFFRPAVLNSKLLDDSFIDFYTKLFSLPGAQDAKLKTIRSVCNFWGPKQEVLNSTMSNLNKITAPTLILWGKDDEILNVEQASFAKGKIPNSQLYIFGQCGHMPNFEKPDEFNSVVLAFLSG
jgi:4,5:9,10-diseco-3-hydroxy-5,9,17-trioxoandrosta-1(10),2-diene-4-oate hydrolase